MARWKAVWCLLFLLKAVGSSTQVELLQKLPSLEELINQGTIPKEKSHKLTETCFVRMKSPQDCQLLITPDPSNCATFEMARKALVPNLDIGNFIRVSLPDNAVVSSITVDTCKSTCIFAIPSDSTVTLVPDLIVLTNSTLNVNVNQPNNEAALGIVGSWLLGDMAFQITADKTPDNETTIAGSTTGNIPIGKLVSAIGQKILPGNTAANALSSLGFDNVVISKLGLGAKYSQNESAIQFNIRVESATFGNPELLISVNSIKPNKKIFMVAGLMGETRLSTVIKEITTIDISPVPYLGTLSSPYLKMLYANEDVEKPFLPIEDKILASFFPMKDDIKLAMALKLSSSSAVTEANATVNGKSISFTLVNSTLSVRQFVSQLFPKSLDFINNLIPGEFQVESFLDVHLYAFAYDDTNKIFTLPVKTLTPITLIPKALVLNNTTMTFTINTGSSNGGNNLGIALGAEWDIGKLTMALSISKPIGEKVYIGSARVLDPIPFGDMIKKFAIALLPSGPLEDAVNKIGLSSFYIKDAEVRLYFGTEKVVKVKGTTAVGSWNKCQVEVSTGQVGGSVAMVTGLALSKVPISEIVSELTGGVINMKVIPGVSLLDNTDMAIVMSSQPVPKVKEYMQFTLPVLYNIEIVDGVSLVGSFKFPENCNDVLCKVAKRLLGADAHLVITGRLAVAFVYLSAAVPTEIPLFSDASVTDLGFEIKASAGLGENAIGIKGSLKFKDPPLTFTGAFGFGTSGVYLEMSMAGMWKKPFGVPVLAIGDLHFKVAVGPDPVAITALGLGGKGKLGLFDNKKATPIEAEMYIGIDRVSPGENYFHGKISALTIPAILKAFAQDIRLPKPLEEIGYPEGLYASFSLQTKTLPNGIVIPRGFYLQGTLQILFFKAAADMRLDLNGLFINLTVSPFNIGNGLVSLSGVTQKGPRIFTDISWNPPKAYINIEGSLTVLGITSTTNITVDSKGMSFMVSGKFLNLFEAGLSITSSYNLKTADFQVKGYFRQSLFEKLAKMVKNALLDYKNKADKSIGDAQDKVRSAEKAFDAAKGAIASLQSKVNREKSKFDSANRELQNAKSYLEKKKKIFDDANKELTKAQNDVNSKKKKFDDAVNYLERLKRKACPSACRRKRGTGTFMKKSRASSLLGNDRRKRVKRGWGIRFRRLNVIERGREAGERAAEWTREKARETKCALQYAARQVCLKTFDGAKWTVSQTKKTLDAAVLVLEGVKKTVSASKSSLDLAKLGLSAAQGVVSAAKKSLDLAIVALEGGKQLVETSKFSLDAAVGILEAAKQVNGFGVAIASEITKWGLGGLIDIKELTFDVKLSVANTGHFRGSITAVLVGQQSTFSIDVKLNSLTDMVKSLVNRVKKVLKISKRDEIPWQHNLAVELAKLSLHSLDDQSCSMYKVVSKISAMVLVKSGSLAEIMGKLRNITEKNPEFKIDVQRIANLSRAALKFNMKMMIKVVSIFANAAPSEISRMLDVNLLKQKIFDLAKGTQPDTCIQGVIKSLSPILNEEDTDEIKLIETLKGKLGCLLKHPCISHSDTKVRKSYRNLESAEVETAVAW